jgi:glycerol kinase
MWYFFPKYRLSCSSRWHDHDAEEIQEVADKCIAEACKELEKAGWAKESVKVIGTSAA